QLGIGDRSEAEQEEIITEAQRRLGEAISEGLSEQQLTEYQAIIDADQAVIDAWLEQNMPDYKETPLYQEAEAGFADDPDHTPGDKIVASAGWVQQNVPNLEEATKKTIEEYAQELTRL
ncbi:hypothetical protein GW746_01720, partial [Candidatus Saccharibacteria bacterium]|nr:hypothetical protein [Candidatus Saccharibacteria bacterium]